MKSKKLDRALQELDERFNGNLKKNILKQYDACLDCTHCSIEGEEPFCNIRREDVYYSSYESGLADTYCMSHEPYPYGFRYKLNIKNYL